MSKNKECKKGLCVGKIISHAVALWFVCYVYACTPFRWTSTERVVYETLVRMALPIMVLNPLASIDGTLFQLDPKKLLPMEPTPPYVEIGRDVSFEKGVQTLQAAWQKQDAIIVWKGMADAMSQYRSHEYVKNRLNDDNYEFLINYSNFESKNMNYKSVIDKMDEYYLGFSYNLLNNNKDTLLADFNNMIAAHGPELANIVPVNASLHHAFLYKGKKYRTGMHQAPVSDWFFQVANSKTWRFVQPRYTPYMKPLTWDGVSMMSGFDFMPSDCGIPFLDVNTDAGDMMFFPAHWWHEVWNNDPEEIGLAFGFRPHGDVQNAAKDMLFPLFANPGVVGHRAIFFGGVVKTIIEKFTKKAAGATTINGDSGLKGRIAHLKTIEKEVRQHIPTWSWDRFRYTGNDNGNCAADGTCA